MTTDKWSLNSAVEIELYTDDNFLQIKETLTRIGIVSNDKTTIWQTCHILSKGGKYFLIHYKGMLALDGMNCDLLDLDYNRQCKIALLLQRWNLCHVVSDVDTQNDIFVKVVPFRDKHKWTLEPKYIFQSDK